MPITGSLAPNTARNLAVVSPTPICAETNGPQRPAQTLRDGRGFAVRRASNADVIGLLAPRAAFLRA